MMGWILVRFTRDKSGDVIPEGWLHKNKEQAYWPNCGTKEVQELIKNNEKVNLKWKKWKVSLLSEIRYGTYDEAVKAFEQQCKTFQRIAEETEDESVLLKRKTKATSTIKPTISSLSIPFTIKAKKKGLENEESTQKEKDDVISLENLNEDDNGSLTSCSDDNDRNEDSDKERESDGSLSIINQNQMDPKTPTPPGSNEENKDDNPNPLPSPVNPEENEGDGSDKEDTIKASSDDKSESNDLKEIKNYLLEIKMEVKDLKTAVDEKRYFDSKYDYAEIEALLPLCDEKGLEDFDKKIKDEKDYEYKVIKCFRTYGGRTERKIATKIMERLLTYPLASMFSMKGGKQKESFTVLNVYKTITKVVKHTMTQPNEDEIYAAVDSYLRHAPDNVPTEEEERSVKKRKRTFQVKLPFYLTVKPKEKAVTDQAKEEVAPKKAKTNETTGPKTDPPPGQPGPSAVPLNIEVNKS